MTAAFDYVAAFWAKVDRSGTCWLWTAALNEHGYGVAWNGKRTRLAHRLAYEYTHGSIPEGKELDHLCRTPACVNPEHLEPVTHAENVRRGRSYWAERTHCKNGHEFTPENTRMRGNARVCRACKNASERLARRRRRSAMSGVDDAAVV